MSSVCFDNRKFILIHFFFFGLERNCAANKKIQFDINVNVYLWMNETHEDAEEFTSKSNR